MQKFISLSPAVAGAFEELTGKTAPEWFCSHDPVEARLGSGGGTVHLLREAYRATKGERGETPPSTGQEQAEQERAALADWLTETGGIVLHAGGQSRRLPGYAAEGKALIPVPVFRWSVGQQVNQTHLDLQVPLLERILGTGCKEGRWLIASGDVLIEADPMPERLPDADVVCLGQWGEPEQATRHGVFFTPRGSTSELSFMLQKPSLQRIRELSQTHYFLLDVGVWILSARAMRVLLEKALRADGSLAEYDLYGAFGPAMGEQPEVQDRAIAALSTAIVHLEGPGFYHFGSAPDLIASCLRLQNKVVDQRRISSFGIKPHPSMFVQNARIGAGVLTPGQSEIWIENSHVPSGWRLSRRHLITGVPDNDWALELPEGACLEVLPMAGGGQAVRPYGFKDPFRGSAGDPRTLFLGLPFVDWLSRRGLSLKQLGIASDCDLQQAPIFPVFVEDPDACLLQWMLTGEDDRFAERYAALPRLSAEELAAGADLSAIQRQRRRRLAASLPLMAENADQSIFYQLDLEHLAGVFHAENLALPEKRPHPQNDLFRFLRDAMFRSRVEQLRGRPHEADAEAAFAALRDALIESAQRHPVHPELNCLEDQIIWGRSPVRLDLAGGWTDTPPYCFLNGGQVINLAVELNGQPPIQVFVRRRRSFDLKIRSIDLGVSEELSTFGELGSYANLGSGFAIPKAALALCGFLPEFHSGDCPDSLEGLLRQFGSGIEISLLCAVPKGSGLGTSSILAAAILGVLSEFCQLGWDAYAIAQRVLVLGQMLPSGGGWPDQYGGICRGLKFLETNPGLDQSPRIRWLDANLFTHPAHASRILLYYTGITRVAKNVLGEIVRGMFLNSNTHLQILRRIGENAERLREGLQEGSFDALADGVARSWELNKALDSGTNPPAIEHLLSGLESWLSACKLLGAGGGGYLLLLARDAECAVRLREHLEANPPNSRARFVDWSVSSSGFQITRS